MKAAAAEPIPFWWFHGEVEVGGRFFANNPERGGRADLGGSSLAKYYEYSKIAPGPFSNIWLSTGSSNGLYQIDFAGKNIGYSDQSYYLDFSQAGKQYLSLGWDQTPHVYSYSASTPFYTRGNALIFDQSRPGCSGPFNAAVNNGAAIIPCEHTTDIAIRRDTASLQYRYTPTDAWDFKADYSHMHRTGSQIAGIVAGSFSPVQVARPVDDTTQNYGLNGEYAGTSSWGQRFVAKLGYSGSQYGDAFSAYTVQNPQVLNGVATSSNPALAQISTPPSNSANGFNGTLTVDLPWKSRYAGTVNYNMMRQNDTFIPMSSQLSVLPAGTTMPASSLNGKIDTFLSNNVLTSKITPELTNKLTYRYYDFNNSTPELTFLNWIRGDATATSSNHNVRSLSINYTKQNAGDELVWQPNRQWRLGAAYGFERYDYTRVDASATNENTGKVFADWKPTNWLSFRSSGSYGSRHYENYDYLNNVGLFQWVGINTGAQYQSGYRQLMISDRQSWKANFATDIVVARGVTITPTFKYQDEHYGVNPANQYGLEDRRLYSAGIDTSFVINPRTSVSVGYMRDYVTQNLFGTCLTATTGATCNNTATPVVSVPAYYANTDDKATYDTVTFLLRHAAIPDKLDTELRYAASHGVDALRLNLGTGLPPSGGQFPDMTTWYQRLDATATYKFDQSTIAALGWKGQVKAKLRYTWERNSVGWWATDFIGLNQVTAGSANSNILMAADNPNYNVHLIAASLAYQW